MAFTVRNPEYEAKVRQIFDRAAFIADLGIVLDAVAPGRCESTLRVQPKHLQQDRFIHAGVQATMADHTAGAAAASLVGAEETVLTVEFKINLLRPATGAALRCRSTVLRQGRTLMVVESEVAGGEGGAAEKLFAKATVTLAVVETARVEG